MTMWYLPFSVEDSGNHGDYTSISLFKLVSAIPTSLLFKLRNEIWLYSLLTL